MVQCRRYSTVLLFRATPPRVLVGILSVTCIVEIEGSLGVALKPGYSLRVKTLHTSFVSPQSLPWKDDIVAVGLARGIPNFKGEKHEHAEFVGVIERCRALGWQITAHVGAPLHPGPGALRLCGTHDSRCDARVSFAGYSAPKGGTKV